MDFRSELRPYIKQYLLSECELLSKSSTQEEIKSYVDSLYVHLKSKPYIGYDILPLFNPNITDDLREYEILNPTLHLFQSPRELVFEFSDSELVPSLDEYKVLSLAEYRVLSQINTLFYLTSKEDKDPDEILRLRKDPEHKRWVSHPSQLTTRLLENLWSTLDVSEQISSLQIHRHILFLSIWLSSKHRVPVSQFELLEGIAKIGAFTWFSKDSVWVSENPVVVRVGFKKVDLIFKDGWEFSYDLPEKFQDLAECEFSD